MKYLITLFILLVSIYGFHSTAIQTSTAPTSSYFQSYSSWIPGASLVKSIPTVRPDFSRVNDLYGGLMDTMSNIQPCKQKEDEPSVYACKLAIPIGANEISLEIRFEQLRKDLEIGRDGKPLETDPAKEGRLVTNQANTNEANTSQVSTTALKTDQAPDDKPKTEQPDKELDDPSAPHILTTVLLFGKTVITRTITPKNAKLPCVFIPFFPNFKVCFELRKLMYIVNGQAVNICLVANIVFTTLIISSTLSEVRFNCFPLAIATVSSTVQTSVGQLNEVNNGGLERVQSKLASSTISMPNITASRLGQATLGGFQSLNQITTTKTGYKTSSGIEFDLFLPHERVTWAEPPAWMKRVHSLAAPYVSDYIADYFSGYIPDPKSFIPDPKSFMRDPSKFIPKNLILDPKNFIPGQNELMSYSIKYLPSSAQYALGASSYVNSALINNLPYERFANYFSSTTSSKDGSPTAQPTDKTAASPSEKP